MVSVGIRVGGLGLSFLQAVLTARLLGPAGYGTVAALLSIVQVLAVIGMVGLGPLAVREIAALQAAGQKGRIAGFLGLSLGLTMAASVILAALTAWVVIPAWGAMTATESSLAFAGVLIVPLALLGLLRGWAQGFGRIANAQIPAEVLRPAVIVGVMIAALATGARFAEDDYLWVAILAATLAVLVSLGMLWQSNLRSLPRPGEPASLAKTTATALPFLGLSLAAILQGEINTLLLAALATPEETGLFQPIARLAPLLVLPVQAAGMRYAPRVSELWRNGERERLVAITRTFTWSTTLLTLVLGLALSLAGPWLMLAFGEQFVATAPLLWIMAAAQLFNAACGPVGMILMMSDHARLALMGTAVGLSVNVILGFSLIPHTGITGATIAMASGTLAWNLALLIANRRTTKIPTSLLSFPT